MSSNAKSESLTSQLERLRNQHRKRHLSEQLNEIGETMEETILKRELAEAFFEDAVAVDDKAKAAVQEMRDLLASNEYDAVEAHIDEVETEVNRVETSVDNQIQELRISRSETVSAMQRLNSRVERVNEVQLEALGLLLDEWQWKEQVYLRDDGDLEELKKNAREYGQEMSDIFATFRDELFGHYPSEIKDLIHQMIDDERLAYADLTDKQRRLLAESDVGEYIALRLS